MDETFDDSSKFTFESPAEFFIDDEDYFGINNGASSDYGLQNQGTVPANALSYTNADGAYIEASGLNEVRIQWLDLNIEGFFNLQFTGSFAANPNGDFSSKDQITVRYSVDGSFREPKLLSFRPWAVPATLRRDFDLDDTGDGSSLGVSFSTVTMGIPVVGSTLSLYLDLGSNGAGSEIAVDSLLIIGESTPAPSAVPTTAPTGVEEGFFARFGGGACAEKLPFGPELLTSTGSVDGLNPYYFSTNAALDVVSDNWLQIVTSDGINDLFRVLWHFSDSKSVTARMSSAATVGEAVIWTVVDTSNSGTEYILSGLWRFSSAAGANTTDLFVGASGSELSASGGAWGAATGVLDGGFGPVPTDFWGQGKFAGTDSACQEVFLAGNGTTQYPSPVTYMYSADPSPTTAPTAVPTTSVPTALPTVSPTDTLQPTVAPTELPLPVIFLEKFKSSHQFSMTPPATFFSDAEGDFFGINAVLGSGIHDFGIAGGSALLPDQAVQFLGVDGSFLHASHLDGSPGVVNPVELVWQGINVNGISELIFTGLFGAQSPAQFDDTDGILLEFSVDGGPRQTLISFSGETSLPCHPNCGISSNMREDSTSPTPRSSLYLGQTMRSYSKMRPVSTGQSLTLYLTISSDSGSKQLAVDELVLGMLVYLRHECTLVGSKKRVLLCMKQLLYLSIAYFVFSVSNTYFYPPR